MKHMRQALAAAGLAIAGVVGSTTFAGTASAADEALAAYNGACGSGYHVVDQGNVDTLGTGYLTWNEDTRRTCVVTLRTAPGDSWPMIAEITLTDDERVSVFDSGSYPYQAGPVYLRPRGGCVDWEAWIDMYNVQRTYCPTSS